MSTRPATRAERQAAMSLAAQGAAKAAAPPPPPPIPEPAPEPPREPTAVEQLAALAELRRKHNRLVVPPPAALGLDSARAWLRQVAAVGAHGDVEIAWHRIQDRIVKEKLLNEYEALKASAGKRYAALYEAARQERECDRAAARRRAEAAQLRKAAAQAEAKLTEMNRKLAEMDAG